MISLNIKVFYNRKGIYSYLGYKIFENFEKPGI